MEWVSMALERFCVLGQATVIGAMKRLLRPHSYILHFSCRAGSSSHLADTYLEDRQRS